MTSRSASHLVLIPSYNPGEKVFETVAEARARWSPVWVVVDGSTDGSGERLQRIADGDPGLRVIVLPDNRGKGGAVLAGLELAVGDGYSHALLMDSDGQHPADCIERFMAASRARPEAMILGVPIFGDDAPLIRVRGRRISNWVPTVWATAPRTSPRSWARRWRA